MKLLKSPKYHIISLLGFVAYLFCTLTLEKLSYYLSFFKEEEQKISAARYYISEGIICGVLAYIISNLILWYVETQVNFATIKKKGVFWLALVFLNAVILYFLALWPLLNIPFNYFLGKDITIPFKTQLTNLAFFATIFAIWLFIIMAVKIYRYINEVKVSRLQLETTLRESQLNTLKGQINPHFMFNSLNNIRGLILEDPQRSRDMITRLSEMLRYSLTKNGVNTIPLKEELQTVDNYIEISKIQFEGRLQFTLNVSPETLNIAIPPMIVQMLVENAAKHGIGKLREGGTIHLSAQVEDAALVIIVANSGRLNIEEGSTRLGLENIKKRLELIFGNSATFSLTEKGNFVEAKICIPL
jgi:two-component system, LytTR family, sensor kinase